MNPQNGWKSDEMNRFSTRFFFTAIGLMPDNSCLRIAAFDCSSQKFHNFPPCNFPQKQL